MDSVNAKRTLFFHSVLPMFSFQTALIKNVYIRDNEVCIWMDNAEAENHRMQ